MLAFTAFRDHTGRTSKSWNNTQTTQSSKKGLPKAEQLSKGTQVSIRAFGPQYELLHGDVRTCSTKTGLMWVGHRFKAWLAELKWTQQSVASTHICCISHLQSPRISRKKRTFCFPACCRTVLRSGARHTPFSALPPPFYLQDWCTLSSSSGQQHPVV